MKNSTLFQPERRSFLTKVMPACAVSCIGLTGTPAIAKSLLSQDKHKFDQVLPGIELTYRNYMNISIRHVVGLARFLEKEYGKEKMIELLRKNTDERMTERGKLDLKEFGKSDLKTYTAQFKSPQMQAALTFDVIEDTDKVFEIKVSECLSASVFKEAKAADIGHASVCWGDYAWATSFNPKIELIRDKTLMEGHDCCNHKYVFRG